MSTDIADIAKGNVLLPIARSSIASTWGETLQVDESALWLQELGACFVTLSKQGELRGCIGSLEARRILLQDVKENALSAAFRDPRFAPLTANELSKIEVEVSLLSAIKPLEFSSELDALEQLEPGIHGVVFEYGRYRSTFLPQVWEQLPNVDEFMSHLKNKAGLSPNFWNEAVKLSCYTVSKWKESDVIETTFNTG